MRQISLGRIDMKEVDIGFSFTSIPWEKGENKDQILREMNETISKFVSERDYGESIETILIGLLANDPIYDAFSKPHRPRYTEHKETKAFGSIPIVIHKSLELEIKLNYEQVLAAEGKEFIEMIALEVLNLFHGMKLPKKVTDFDRDRFVADMDKLFHEKFLN